MKYSTGYLFVLDQDTATNDFALSQGNPSSTPIEQLIRGEQKLAAQNQLYLAQTFQKAAEQRMKLLANHISSKE